MYSASSKSTASKSLSMLPSSPSPSSISSSQNTPPMAASSSSSPSSAHSANYKCSNCSTASTPLWRRDMTGKPICNACGLYFKIHGHARPISIQKSKSSIVRRRKRSSKPLITFAMIPLVAVPTSSNGPSPSQHPSSLDHHIDTTTTTTTTTLSSSSSSPSSPASTRSTTCSSSCSIYPKIAPNPIQTSRRTSSASYNTPRIQSELQSHSSPQSATNQIPASISTSTDLHHLTLRQTLSSVHPQQLVHNQNDDEYRYPQENYMLSPPFSDASSRDDTSTLPSSHYNTQVRMGHPPPSQYIPVPPPTSNAYYANSYYSEMKPSSSPSSSSPPSSSSSSCYTYTSVTATSSTTNPSAASSHQELLDEIKRLKHLLHLKQSHPTESDRSPPLNTIATNIPANDLHIINHTIQNNVKSTHEYIHAHHDPLYPSPTSPAPNSSRDNSIPSSAASSASHLYKLGI